jgi:hypothetical protein
VTAIDLSFNTRVTDMRKQPSIRKGVSSVARSSRPRPRFSLPELLEGRMLLSAYVVSNTDDSGAGSLRDAINSVNADPTASTITFAIGAGVQTITPGSALPALTQQVTIDGTAPSSFPDQKIVLSGLSAGAGANGLELDAANSVINGLVIGGFSGSGVYLPAGGGDVISNNYIGTDVTGTTAVANGTGVLVSSNGNQLVDNLISGNQLDGVRISGDGNSVQGNLVGTDAAGTAALPNGTLNHLNGVPLNGVTVVNATNTTIGGLTAAARNIISGNNEDGVAFISDSGTGNVVEGNYIGLDITGTVAVSNLLHGVDLGTDQKLSVSNVIIGGTAAGARNVIAGNLGNGVWISASTNNVVEGNFIGTDITGAASPLTNQADGVMLVNGSSGNTIGGATASARNILSGNLANGVEFVQTSQSTSAPGANAVLGNYIGTDVTGTLQLGNGSDGIYVGGGTAQISGNILSNNNFEGVELAVGGNTLTGNLIGTDLTGTVAMANLDAGVLIYSNNNVVGGTAAGAGNVIAYNASAGVDVLTGVGNVIRGNSMFGNAALGIDLGGDGVTLNDSAGHAGANLFQNFPVLSAATASATSTMVAGTLTAAPGVYLVDIYVSTSPDPSGYGQGQTFLGSVQVTVNSSGVATFSATLPVAVPSGELSFSATATDSSGNTSEFSHYFQGITSSVSATNTLLTSSADPSTFGQSITFRASVAANGATPTGSVVFTDGTTVLGTVALPPGSGVATLTLPAGLSVGGHTITATYSDPSGNFTGSSSSLVQTVNRANSVTSLVSSANPSNYLASVTFTATVSSAVAGVTPTGNVTFFDGATSLGTVNLVNGGATVSTSTLTVGDHRITAIYNSDTNFSGSGSTPLTQTVNAPGNSISGKVYRDKTGDGLSADDSVMSGVTVQLLQNQAGKMVVVQSTSSDITGSFAFTNLPAGTYQVQEVTPTGFVRTAPTTQAYYTNTLSGGGVVTADNFDNYMEGCCCDGSLSNVHYIIDGRTVVTDLRGHVHQGDTVQAVFTVDKGYIDTLSLVSYIAPGASFSAANASQQTIYQDATGTFGPGTYTLCVVVPKCYFQVDFVCGYAIDKFGPAGSNIFYSAQDRLISADNGGTNAAPITH